MLRVFGLLCCLTVLLAGCSSYQQYAVGSSSGWIVAGSRITLHQELIIPANQTRLFLQRGQVLINGVDQYYPSCNFEIRTLSDGAQKISPDEFVVIRVQEGFEEVVGINKPVRIAALGTASLYGVFGSNQTLVSRFVHFYLESERQPDVMRLTCRGAFDFMWDAELPAPGEMREALGEIATLGAYPEPGIIK